MNRFFLFLKKIYVFLLFVVLEIIAINHYASSTSYTKAKLLTASNTVVGSFHSGLSAIGDYFGLRAENDLLLERIAGLQNELEIMRERENIAGEVRLSDMGPGKYHYMTASVINNSITRQENYITLDKGERDGVRINMALLTPEGSIAGYVLDASEKFSIAISVLNTSFKTGGKIKGKDYFGSIWWDGTDNRYITLSEIPKYADIMPGDTIVTGYSSIFPPDAAIGTVESFALNQSNYYDVKVKLTTQMSRLGKLLIVDYADIHERMLLEQEYN